MHTNELQTDYTIIAGKLSNSHVRHTLLVRNIVINRLLVSTHIHTYINIYLKTIILMVHVDNGS